MTHTTTKRTRRPALIEADVVECRKLLLRDKAGVVRVCAGVMPGGVGLVLADDRGRPRLGLVVDGDGGRVNLLDSAGVERLQLLLQHGGEGAAAWKSVDALGQRMPS